MSLLPPFVKDNIWIILFYLGIFLLIYYNRSKFEIQGRIIALYRTRFGIKTIERFSSRHNKLVKGLGYIGILVGYIGLVGITYIILDGFIKLFTTPDAPPTITPVIPGVKIPGSPIFVPFWYGIIALFVVVFIHEFSHGIVASAHKIKIKNTGFGMMAILPIAFVEPDEKDVAKRPYSVQNSIFAAGPFSNILSAIIAFLLMIFILSPALASMTQNLGVSIIDVQDGTPAETAGIYPNMTIVKIDSNEVNNLNELQDYLVNVSPNQTILIESDKGESFTLTTTSHPNNPSKGYVGVIGLHTKTQLKNPTNLNKIINIALDIIANLFLWIFILSLGIGLANLLPLGPVDGGRMLQIACWRLAGSKERGDFIWKKISIITLMLLIVLLILPIFRATIGI